MPNSPPLEPTTEAAAAVEPTPVGEPSPTLLDETPPAPAPTPFDPATFAFPEGIEVTDAQKISLGEVATKYNIPQEAMTDLMKMYAETASAVSDRVSTEVTDAWNTTMNEWQTATKTLYGAELPKALTMANTVLDEFGTPELKEALRITGLGNHVEIFKFLGKISEKVGEAAPVPAGGTPAPAQDGIYKLYPSMAPKE